MDPSIGPALLAAALAAFLFARRSVSPRLVLWALCPVLGTLVLVQGLQLAGGELSLLPDSQRVRLDLPSDLQNVEGNPLVPAAFPGEVLLINYWATWCLPCREEMPSLDRLQRELRGGGLRVLAVTEEPSDRVRKFLQGTSFSFQVALDPSAELKELLDVRALPTTVVLDGNGYTVLRHVGFRDWSSPDRLRFFRGLLAVGVEARASWEGVE